MTNLATMQSRANQKLRVFLDFTAGLAGLSTCTRRQVGAIVIDSGLTEVLSIGYNGPPSGVPNDSCTGVEGTCGCIHAEANAVAKLRSTSCSLTLVTTAAPCAHCAGLIVNTHQFKRVLYLEPFRDPRGVQLLSRSPQQISCLHVHREPKT